MAVEPAEPVEPAFAAVAELEPLLPQAVSASAPAASSAVTPIADRSLARPGLLPEFFVIVRSPKRVVKRTDAPAARGTDYWRQ
jgi:hypothetical protein